MAGLTVAQKEAKRLAQLNKNYAASVEATTMEETSKEDSSVKVSRMIEDEQVAVEFDAKEHQRKLDLIAGLKQFGIEGDTSKTSDELMKELIEAGSSIKRTYSHTEEDKLKSQVANYKTDTNLTNDAFIARLIKLGVPKMYVTRQSDKSGKVQWYLFHDVDKELNDEAIWFRINNSGINPLKPQELFLKNKKF